ncbi:MAG: transporter substrate-binding domain-containing protein [Firmicutes bacterium]|nr:transporter substrate-binding domain-containing protein [Bacillota bacterium]
MKKVYVVLSLLLVFSLLLSACGENNAPSITEWTDLDGKTLAVFGLAVSEDDFAEMINSKLGIELKSGVIVPTPAEMALLIQNGQVDAGSTHVYNAKYICARNDDLDYIVGKTMAASMVFVKGSGLKSEIDQAIAALKADGTIDNLVDTWLSDEAMKSDPQPAVLETIPGADTIKVGISGVLAPMDYATADGKPGGFNVALIGEISKHIGKNVEFVNIDPDSRFLALSSGTIDMFFWNFYNTFITEDYEISEPYLEDNGALIIRKAAD